MTWKNGTGVREEEKELSVYNCPLNAIIINNNNYNTYMAP